MKLGRWFDITVVIALLFLAIFSRFVVLDFKSADATHYFLPYYEEIQERGASEALKYRYGNSMPMYVYGLVIATYLPIPPVFAFKFAPIFFDVVCAVWAYLIVRFKYGHKSPLPLVAASAVLFLPTMFMNSSVWGQWDSVYTSFLLGTLYCLLHLSRKLTDSSRHKLSILVFLLFSVALSAKIQSLFFVIPLIWALLAGKLYWRYLIIVPAVYGLFMLPLYIAGMPFNDVLRAPLDQVNAHRFMSTSAPTIYQFMPSASHRMFKPVALAFAGSTVLALTWFACRRLKYSANQVIYMAMLSTLVIPFLLPQMHERYFFSADLISFMMAFYLPHLWFVPLFLMGMSFMGYMKYLFIMEVLPLHILSLIMTSVISFVVWYIIKKPGLSYSSKK